MWAAWRHHAQHPVGRESAEAFYGAIDAAHEKPSHRLADAGTGKGGASGLSNKQNLLFAHWDFQCPPAGTFPVHLPEFPTDR